MTWSKRTIYVGLLFAMFGCATNRYSSLVDHAMTQCKEITGPDAEKGEGEVMFWLQSRRAETSRKLWSRQGLAAIEAKQTAASDSADLACLARLHQEASIREIVSD